MTGTEYLLAFLLGLISVYFLFQKSKRRNQPPGPWGFPILGHLPLLGTEPHKTLHEWTQSKRFGPVISIKFGSYPTIVINDPKLIKEALNDTAFSGRPDINFFKDRSGGTAKGIIFTEGQQWMEQRRFSLRNLRDFGFGTKSMESIVQQEVSELIERFRKDIGKPVSTRNLFNAAVVNALWTILTGERFNQDDPELQKTIEMVTASIEENNTLQGLATFLPLFAKIAPKLSGYDHMMKDVEPVLNFLRKPIVHHEKTFVPGQMRDFLDVYIQETKNTTDTNSSFHSSKTGILFVLVDLFIAGAETTSTALSWAFLYLSKFPEVQKKLQDEIDKVVGNSRLPSLADRPSMVYTQAVIHEVLRYSSLAPFGIFHNTTQEVKLAGYTIPKNTMVIPNFYAAHFDENSWDKPQLFNPDRFIQDGEFKRNEAFMVFSTGKRVCLGETLARDELFLFMTSLFQRFTVSTELKPSELDLTGHVSTILSSKPYKYILKERF